MPDKLPWKPWHKVVKLRDDVRTGELALADFAADLHDVMMQQGTHPVYEDPARFFALTYPTLSLRDLAKDVALRLAGRNTKAIRQLEQPYGGGKTHTLITLRHLAASPASLPSLPAIETFKSHIGLGDALPRARVVALSFDKIDVEKGMAALGPQGEARELRQPWSLLAYQLAGDEGLRALHPDGKSEERSTPPAELLLTQLLALPQKEDLATLVLIDEALMYAREKALADPKGRGRLIDFFQYLCQAVTKVKRSALVASLLASDPEQTDKAGKKLVTEIAQIFGRQREEGVQPVQKEDVAEVLRRRFFEPKSIANPDAFRPHVTKAVANLAALDDSAAQDRTKLEKRFLASYPFHPDLTDFFYTRWTQLDRFQRTRGILRAFALALRDAEHWDQSPLVSANVLLPAPGQEGIAEAARELTTVATQEIVEGRGQDWTTVLEGELGKAKVIQAEQPGLRHREIEQAVCSVFLGSQPIGQKTSTGDLIALVGATSPGRIELAQGLRQWTEASWFLDESEYGEAAGGEDPAQALPRFWRLGNLPNLKQMHDHACRDRVAAEAVEQRLLEEVRSAKGLTDGAKGAGAAVHLLPEQPRDIADDGAFHFAILGPKAASTAGKPSREAQRLIDETTSADRPRTGRNALVLVAPSPEGLETVRKSIRTYLGWVDVAATLKGQAQDPIREGMLANWTGEARSRIQSSIRQAWSVVIAVDERNEVSAFQLTVGPGPLFATVKDDKRCRIQDSAISAEAILPGGPYDLWRQDEASRRVKDLVGAFAENAKLPKMLRSQEIYATIGNGVRDGILVASLPRPDKSVRTWWRTQVEERDLQEAALEVSLPAQATLTALGPRVLEPDTLPGLWQDGAATVADLTAYFAGGKIVMVQREGYEEPVAIPACPAEQVHAAITQAVEQGMLWLVHGPASVQGEPLVPGVLADAAKLQAPMAPLRVDQLSKTALPEAWKDDQTTADALLLALNEQAGDPVPWAVLRTAIDDAVQNRWLALAPNSGKWPCELVEAAKIRLKIPEGVKEPKPGQMPQGAYAATATLEPAKLQDLAEALPEILKATAGLPLAFTLSVALGDGKEIDQQQLAAISQLLKNVHPDLALQLRP